MSLPAGGSAPVTAAGVDRRSPVEQHVLPPKASTLLALRQNTNSGWSATQNGQELGSVVLDGWQQGWVTDGTSSPVETRFRPDVAYRWGLGVGGLLLLLLVGLAALLPTRWWGSEFPPLHGRDLPAAVLIPGALVVCGLLGGWIGAAVGALGLGVGLACRHRFREPGPWIVSMLLLAGGLAYFLRPWSDLSGWAGSWAWPHYLALVALSATFATAVPERQFRHLIDGCSTKR